MATKNYTEMQQAFLDALYGPEAKGDVRKAMDIAGYAKSMRPSVVTAALSDEIYELTKKFIAQTSTKAAYAMYEVLDKPNALGNNNKLAAAKDLLDRAGHAKTEKVEVAASTPLFILPEKKD